METHDTDGSYKNAVVTWVESAELITVKGLRQEQQFFVVLKSSESSATVLTSGFSFEAKH